MSQFWDMSAEDRRALVGPNPPPVYSKRDHSLAQLWVECGEDELLMRLRHDDEIRRLESEDDTTIFYLYWHTAHSWKVKTAKDPKSPETQG